MTTTIHTQNRARRRRWIFPVVAGVIAAAAGLTFGLQSASNDALLDTQRADISSLTESISAAEQVEEGIRHEAALLSVGVPKGSMSQITARIDADEIVLKKLFGTIFTWSSDAEYREARRALTTEYGVPETSELLTTLIPEAPASVDADGKRYPYIDAAGLNSQLGKIDIHPTGVVGFEHRYLVIVTAQGASPDGSATASRKTVFDVSVGADSTVTDVRGWASPTRARTAGGQ